METRSPEAALPHVASSRTRWLPPLVALAMVMASPTVLASIEWKELAAAADTPGPRGAAVMLEFAWEIPKNRVLMLAQRNDGQMVIYRFDRKATAEPSAIPAHVQCHFNRDRLMCAGPGQTTATPVDANTGDGWAALEAHALTQIQQVALTGEAALAAQVAVQPPAPQVALAETRHPFEWGGEHETIENAQAFLETLTAGTAPFRSTWPTVPWVGSQGNEWENASDRATLTSTGRCTMLAQSPSRTAIHHNSDFWSEGNVTFHAQYRWQQPIDWRTLRGVITTADGVLIHGQYRGTFREPGLSYLSGWKPALMSVNADRFKPDSYKIAEFNFELLLPANSGIRERVMYAMTFLNIACSAG